MLPSHTVQARRPTKGGQLAACLPLITVFLVVCLCFTIFLLQNKYGELDSCSSSNVAAEAERKRLQTNIRDLEDHIHSMSMEDETWRKKVTADAEKHKALSLQLSQSEEDANKLRDDLERARATIQAQDAKVQGAIVSLQQVSAKLATSEEEYASLLAKCSAAPTNLQTSSLGPEVPLTPAPIDFPAQPYSPSDPPTDAIDANEDGTEDEDDGPQVRLIGGTEDPASTTQGDVRG